MNHARVKSQDLRFHLFERSIHPELFQALRRVDIDEGGYRAALVISGQSHVIAVRAAGETVTEVVAPADLCLPRIGVKAAVQLGRAAREEVRRDEGRIRYSAALRVETHAPAAYREAAARLLAEDRLERIKAFFDDDCDARAGKSAAQGDLLPFALIDYRRGPTGLVVSWAHACPHELAIVLGETTIGLGDS